MCISLSIFFNSPPLMGGARGGSGWGHPHLPHPRPLSNKWRPHPTLPRQGGGRRGAQN
jgi:hypothetical protein